jgi:tRNA modification GTPase
VTFNKGCFTFVARERVQSLRDTIQSYLSDHRRGELVRSGIRLAIFGPPNAGKSSLLNFLGMSHISFRNIFTDIFLAKREAAIVTPLPGTTRDVLELALDIGGLPLIVADTAGLRNTDELVESIGIERAKDASVFNSFICSKLLTDIFIIESTKQMSLSASSRSLRS